MTVMGSDPYAFEQRITHFATFDRDKALANMRSVLATMGNPHHRLPPVIHVAGTNGKGSTIAILRSLLEAGGYRVHTLTSPHLISLNERVVLAGKPIDLKQLQDALETHEPLAHAHRLTWFEHLICVSLWLCAQVPADVVLLEVGLGGEFDATNVIEHPALCVLTPISIDHSEVLGSDIRGITAIKAGILKSRCPALSAPQDPAVMKVLNYKANALGTPLTCCPPPHIVFPLSLAGPHQQQNAQLALTALEILKDLFPLSEEAITQGLKTTQWKGRLEKLGTHKGCTFWYDVAHNPGSAEVLADFFQQSPGSKTLIMALGTLKDAHETLRPLLPVFQQIVFFTPQSASPFHDPDHLKEVALKMGFHSQIAPSLVQAVQQIPPHITATITDCVIAGSHYIAREVSELQKTLIASNS